LFIDAEDRDTRLLQAFAGFVTLANGHSEALIGAKQQRWADELKWTPPSLLEGPLQLGSEWVM
jgi:hypothetical protein